MPYDVFISYSRRDNVAGRVTQLVERIKADFAAYSGRSGRRLNIFFDVHPEEGIKGMQDWRHAILQGLRESHMLLACLSPSYFESKYCEWEFNEYLNQEVGRTCFGDGVAPVYFVEVPGWSDSDFEQNKALWVAEVRRRQQFDLRPWFHDGESSLRDAAIRDRMRQLNTQLRERITRGELAEASIGNVISHNPHFRGRVAELRRLRETVSLGKPGRLTVVSGLAGMGKTALVVEFAHAYAHEYGGGRWQIQCEGRDDLIGALIELAGPLGLRFDEDERKDKVRQCQLVISALRQHAMAIEPHQSLLILDNVDTPSLLEPCQWQHLPAEAWLHVVATTRLGADALHGCNLDRVFLNVDELEEVDAINLIATFQPSGAFAAEEEHDAARGIVSVLGCFTLAVETAGVYLGQFAGDVSCVALLHRLQREGLAAIDTVAEQSHEGVRHGEIRLAATLSATFQRLRKPELLALRNAAEMPPDHIVLEWVRGITALEFPELSRDAEPGYADPWAGVLRRLIGLRLLKVRGHAVGRPVTVSMHRVVQHLVRQDCIGDGRTSDLVEHHILQRVAEIENDKELLPGELDGLRATCHLWVGLGKAIAPRLSLLVCNLLHAASDYIETARLAELAASELVGDGEHEVACLNLLGAAQLHLGEYDKSRCALEAAHAICIANACVSREWYSTTISNLGALLGETGRTAEAVSLLRTAVELDQSRYGTQHQIVAIRLLNLSRALRDMNEVGEALRVAEAALEIDLACHETSSAAVVSDLIAVANLLQDSGRSSEAQEALERVVATIRANPEKSGGLLATGLRNLARVCEHLEDNQRAESLLRESLAIDEAAIGKRSAAVANDMNNLAVNLRHQGRFDEALYYHNEALQIDLLRRGNDHPKVALRLLNLAVTLHMSGHSARARALLGEAWTVAAIRGSRLGLRILVVRCCIAFRESEQADVLLGQIKTLLSMSNLPNATADPSWDHKPTQMWCEANAGSPQLSLLVRALFESERAARPTPSLEALREWWQAAAVDLLRRW